MLDNKPQKIYIYVYIYIYMDVVAKREVHDPVLHHYLYISR
jgi:hypothetical protein